MPEFRLSELAVWLGCEVEGEADPSITGLAGLEDAGPGDLTFLSDRRRLSDLAATVAGAVVLPPGVETELPTLRTEDPYGAFARLLTRFAPPEDRVFPVGVQPSAAVDPAASLGSDVRIGAHVAIGPDAVVGDGCRLGPGVVIEAGAELGARCILHARSVVGHDCRLGDEVILHAGAVIGADGFGYLPGPEGLRKIPQIGRVVLGDRVEIGANCCIDRATTGVTEVGAGTKIDNLVQVAHNVRIGDHCAISAQTGISGSSRIGNGVTMGGQVGVGDHRVVGDGVKVAGQSGVTRDIEAGGTVFGTPAIEFARAFRQIALVGRLPEMAERLRRLEEVAGGSGRSEEDQ